MRIFISADMEGVAGISSNSQREPDLRDYSWGRKLMTEEVNAAIRGAFEAGAKKVLVNDSHNTMDNLLPDLLDRRAKLITGNRKPLSMMQGISKQFDAALFIGYHAYRGTAQSVMDHTYSEGSINAVHVNGKPAGETYLNGLFAGAFGVPLVMVSGDQSLRQEVQALDPKIEAVVVKEGLSRYCAAHDHPEVACENIQKGVFQALSAPQFPKPLRLRPPYRFEVDLIHTHMADHCLLVPGVVKKGPRKIVFRQSDYITAYKEFLVLLRLACA